MVSSQAEGDGKIRADAVVWEALMLWRAWKWFRLWVETTPGFLQTQLPSTGSTFIPHSPQSSRSTSSQFCTSETPFYPFHQPLIFRVIFLPSSSDISPSDHCSSSPTWKIVSPSRLTLGFGAILPAPPADCIVDDRLVEAPPLGLAAPSSSLRSAASSASSSSSRESAMDWNSNVPSSSWES